MKINHLDLPVMDLLGAIGFFQELMEFRCVFARPDGLTVLLDEDDFALTLSPVPPGEVLQYPTGFHVGFNLSHEHELQRLHDCVCAAGLSIVRPLGDLGGALTFQCEAPGPLLIEFAWRQPG